MGALNENPVHRTAKSSAVDANGLEDLRYGIDQLERPVGKIDIAALRLDQSFCESFLVKKHVTHVPVERPGRSKFFRVRQGEDWRVQIMLLQVKGEREAYALMPAAWNVVSELARPVVLHAALDRQNNISFIPVPLPGPDGRRSTWHESLAESVRLAENHWVRVAANMNTGSYEVFVAQGSLSEPVWPEFSMQEMFEIASRGRVIADENHPVIDQLMGRA